MLRGRVVVCIADGAAASLRRGKPAAIMDVQKRQLSVLEADVVHVESRRAVDSGGRTTASRRHLPLKVSCGVMVELFLKKMLKA
jgi:hypothetical protein